MDLARATLVLIRVLRTLINSIAKNLHKLQICLRFYSFYKKLDIQANSQLPDLNRPFSRRPPVCSLQASPLSDGGFLPPFPPYSGGVRCATRFKFFLQKKSTAVLAWIANILSQLPDLNRPFSRRLPVCSLQASTLTDGALLPPFPPYSGGVRCATRFNFFCKKKSTAVLAWIANN